MKRLFREDVYGKGLRLIRNLYCWQTLATRIEGETSSHEESQSRGCYNEQPDMCRGRIIGTRLGKKVQCIRIRSK